MGVTERLKQNNEVHSGPVYSTSLLYLNYVSNIILVPKISFLQVAM